MSYVRLLCTLSLSLPFCSSCLSDVFLSFFLPLLFSFLQCWGSNPVPQACRQAGGLALGSFCLFCTNGRRTHVCPDSYQLTAKSRRAPPQSRSLAAKVDGLRRGMAAELRCQSPAHLSGATLDRAGPLTR